MLSRAGPVRSFPASVVGRTIVFWAGDFGLDDALRDGILSVAVPTIDNTVSRRP